MFETMKFKAFGRLTIQEYKFAQDDPELSATEKLVRDIDLNYAQEVADNAIEDCLRGVL